MSVDQLKNLFTYHEPSVEDISKYDEIRGAALTFAYVIERLCPESPDRTVAIRKLREVVFTSNSAIATGGGLYR